MSNDPPHISRLLALLRIKLDHNGKVKSVITSNEEKHLSAIEEKYNELKNSDNKNLGLPNLACTREDYFLKDNVDFYIRYLFLLQNGMPKQKHKNGLVKHLNNCYWCFLDYSQVLKRYFQEVEQLKNDLGKRG